MSMKGTRNNDLALLIAGDLFALDYSRRVHKKSARLNELSTREYKGSVSLPRRVLVVGVAALE